MLSSLSIQSLVKPATYPVRRPLEEANGATQKSGTSNLDEAHGRSASRPHWRLWRREVRTLYSRLWSTQLAIVTTATAINESACSVYEKCNGASPTRVAASGQESGAAFYLALGLDFPRARRVRLSWATIVSTAASSFGPISIAPMMAITSLLVPRPGIPLRR